MRVAFRTTVRAEDAYKARKYQWGKEDRELSLQECIYRVTEILQSYCSVHTVSRGAAQLHASREHVHTQPGCGEHKTP